MADSACLQDKPRKGPRRGALGRGMLIGTALGSMLCCGCNAVGGATPEAVAAFAEEFLRQVLAAGLL